MNKRTARKLAAEAITDAMAEAEWLLTRDWDLSGEERAAIVHQLRVIDRWAWAHIRRTSGAHPARGAAGVAAATAARARGDRVMATQTGSGAPARIYRWEEDHLDDDVNGHVLRLDDGQPQWTAIVANYWRVPRTGVWLWSTMTGIHGEADDEDAARRACLLAALHAPDADEPGQVGEAGR